MSLTADSGGGTSRPSDGRASFLEVGLDPGAGGSGPAPAPASMDPLPDEGYTPVYEDPAYEPPPDTRTCVRVVIWEEWQTSGGGACPKCAPYVGELFEQGDGPYPPLHPHCDCYRFPVKYECYSSTGELVDSWWY